MSKILASCKNLEYKQYKIVAAEGRLPLFFHVSFHIHMNTTKIINMLLAC